MDENNSDLIGQQFSNPLRYEVVAIHADDPNLLTVRNLSSSKEYCAIADFVRLAIKDETEDS